MLRPCAVPAFDPIEIRGDRGGGQGLRATSTSEVYHRNPHGPNGLGAQNREYTCWSHSQSLFLVTSTVHPVEMWSLNVCRT